MNELKFVKSNPGGSVGDCGLELGNGLGSQAKGVSVIRVSDVKLQDQSESKQANLLGLTFNKPFTLNKHDVFTFYTTFYTKNNTPHFKIHKIKSNKYENQQFFVVLVSLNLIKLV